MDLSKTINELYIQKEKLERTIAALEELQAAVHGGNVSANDPHRRGRKSMGKEERRVVSERMKRYWAKRRAAAQKESK